MKTAATSSPAQVLSSRTCCALLFLVATLLVGCGSSGKTKADAADVSNVAVIKVTRQNLSNELEIASEFLPFQEIDVYAKVSGYIQKLYVDWGTHVKQGQLLAVLEIPELQQQLTQDEAGLRRSSRIRNARAKNSAAHSLLTTSRISPYKRLADVQNTRPELVAQQDIDVAQGKDLEASSGVFRLESRAIRRRTSFDRFKGRARQGQSHVRIRANDGALRRCVVTKIYAYTGALLPAAPPRRKPSLPSANFPRIICSAS